MATKKTQITKQKQQKKKLNIGSEAVNLRRTNTMDKRKRTNSDPQNTNDGATRTLLKPRCKFGCSWKDKQFTHICFLVVICITFYMNVT
jgi:hypothetical protein